MTEAVVAMDATGCKRPAAAVVVVVVVVGDAVPDAKEKAVGVAALLGVVVVVVVEVRSGEVACIMVWLGLEVGNN